MVDPNRRLHLPCDDYDQLFRSNRGWAVKIAGAGCIGFAIAVRILWKDWDNHSPVHLLSVLVVVPVVAMLCAAVLVRADVIRRKLREGGRVGLVSRLMFGAGIWSWLMWMIWIELLLLVGFSLAI